MNYSVFIEASIALWHSTRSQKFSNHFRESNIPINSTDYSRVQNEPRITLIDNRRSMRIYRRSWSVKGVALRYKSFAPWNPRRAILDARPFSCRRTKLFAIEFARTRLWTFGILEGRPEKQRWIPKRATNEEKGTKQGPWHDSCRTNIRKSCTKRPYIPMLCAIYVRSIPVHICSYREMLTRSHNLVIYSKI